MKIILYLVLVISFASQGLSQNLQDRNQDDKPRRQRSNRIPKVCSTSDIDVRLGKTGSVSHHNEGLVRISLPRSPHPHYLCFPTDEHEHAQIFQLSHAICRQLGFMTLEEVQGQRISIDAYEGEGNSTTETPSLQNLKPSSWVCHGHEQAVAQCEWNHIEVEPCHQITELTCGNCHKTFNDSEGLIRTPGYPLTFLYHLTCEWRIMVPEAHTIYLVFDQFNASPLEQSVFECASDKPYIELLYGIQDKFSVSRHCNFRQLKNLSIPFNSLKIRYFSGLYNPRALHVQEKGYGLAISFRAVPTTSYSSLWWLFIMTLIAIVILCISGASCYYCRGNSPKQTSLRGMEFPRIEIPNVPGKEDLERAFDFQRCHIQGEKNLQSGLRQRSTGSRSKLSSVFYPVTAASEQLVTTIRKLSSQTTPRTIIPEIVHTNQFCNDGKLLMISKCKTNLEDRFSNRCSESSVFLPVEIEPNFHIYHSESSDLRQDVPSPNNPIPHHETDI